jgi:hypothetical protein
MPENAAILKGFRMFRELSGNLMICAHSRITPLSRKTGGRLVPMCWPVITDPVHMDVKPAFRKLACPAGQMGSNLPIIPFFGRR